MNRIAKAGLGVIGACSLLASGAASCASGRRGGAATMGDVAEGGGDGGGGADSAAAPPRAEGGTGPITYAEIRRVGNRDLYTVIKLLRPQILEYRGQTSFVLQSPTEPDVYVDGMYYGPMSSLRDLPSGEVSRIQLLSVGDAVIRYGTGHTAGVIEVTTRH